MNVYPRSALTMRGCHFTAHNLHGTWQLVYGFGWMTALHHHSVGMVSSYNRWLCSSSSSSTSLCAVIQNSADVLSPRIHVALVTY